MASEKKVSQRDMTLINVLERLGAQIQQYDLRLEEIEKRQEESLQAAERSDSWKFVRQDETDAALAELKKEFLRYRSDMLNVVREQGYLDERMKSLSKRQDMIAGAQEDINRDVANLDKRFDAQEKKMHELYEYSLKQGDMLSGKIVESDRHAAKLHMDTDKRLMEDYRENKRQIEALRSDMMRRLLAFDGIESALQELMVRTEPPEKKPFIMVRLIRRVVGFFRIKLSRLKKTSRSRAHK